MIHLRPMTTNEYPAYCDYFIDDYSREIAANYGHSMEKALELANQDLLRSFPNGLETNDHELLCIELGSELVGYGKMAITALELQLKSIGIEQIKLRVAYQNQRALKLYQEVGFSISGYNMSKKIVS